MRELIQHWMRIWELSFFYAHAKLRTPQEHPLMELTLGNSLAGAQTCCTPSTEK